MSIKPLNHHYAMENPASIYDEEALTALELAGRTTAKVNEVVNSQNEQIQYNEETRTKIMPKAVRDEVDRHIENGDFDNAIDKYAGDVKQQVNNLFAQYNPGSTTVDAEVFDMRVDLNYDGYPSAGDAIRHNFKTLPGPRPAITIAMDLNGFIYAGNYVIATTDHMTNAPDGYYDRTENMRFLVVETFGQFTMGDIPGYGRQTIYNITGDLVYSRWFTINADRDAHNFGEWVEVTPNANTHRNMVESGVDINQIVEQGTYTIAVTDHINGPAGTQGSGFMLEVTNFNKTWLLQTAYPLHNMGNRMYYRTGKNTGEKPNFSSDLNVEWNEWETVATTKDVTDAVNAVGGGSRPGEGCTVVLLGDSLFGSVDDDTSVGAQLAKYSGANVIDCSIGGTVATWHDDMYYNAFSLRKLWDAISTGQWSEQEEAIANAPIGTLPADINTKLERLETVNGYLQTGENIVFITMYGTNDFTAGRPVDSDLDKFSDGALLGCYRHMVGECPAPVIICTPLWRMVGDVPCEEATNDISGSFTEYINALLTGMPEYNPLVVDLFHNFGIGVNNYDRALMDGVHPNSNTRKRMARVLSQKLTEV